MSNLPGPVLLLLATALCWQPPAIGAGASASASVQAGSASMPKPGRPALDHSGGKRRGKASFYSRRLAGNTMADGSTMDPNDKVAASKTLPLGTTARVTNLRNGRSTEVEIRDRGPYVKGRIIDLSPRAARDVGIGRAGVAPVEVAPITVPQADGSVKPGAGAASAARGAD